MGLLLDGKWQDKWYDTKSSGGEFKREDAQLRNWITSNGDPGPTGEGGFKAESGRYHLYVSLACPWAHRTLIFRKLKGLEEHIDVSVVSPIMLENGWSFATNEGSTGEPLFGLEYLHQLYVKNKSDYTGRVTVPVLWDKEKNRIVSNESAEIIRMFNSAFNELTGDKKDFYPNNLKGEINSINELIYETVNNGVYRCGFATSQEAYEKAYYSLFDTLDRLEKILSTHRYLVGQTLTEADWRLFTTLIRFDNVYHGHFKCNLQRIEDFHNLSNYIRDLYQQDTIAETVDFDHIKKHYYYSHTTINPTQIVPAGPQIDFEAKHDRWQLS